MNMTDGVKSGLQIEESIEFAKIFEREGVLDAIELTGGGSQVNQMFMFRGEAPRKEMEAILPNPQRIGFKLLGRLLLKEYPFEEAYFLPMAREIQRERLLTADPPRRHQYGPVHPPGHGRRFRIRGHGPGSSAGPRFDQQDE